MKNKALHLSVSLIFLFSSLSGRSVVPDEKSLNILRSLVGEIYTTEETYVTGLINLEKFETEVIKEENTKYFNTEELYSKDISSGSFLSSLFIRDRDKVLQKVNQEARKKILIEEAEELQKLRELHYSHANEYEDLFDKDGRLKVDPFAEGLLNKFSKLKVGIDFLVKEWPTASEKEIADTMNNIKGYLEEIHHFFSDNYTRSKFFNAYLNHNVRLEISSNIMFFSKNIDKILKLKNIIAGKAGETLNSKINTFRILPAQRPTRYALLFKELKKRFEMILEFPERDLILATIDAIVASVESIAKDINTEQGIKVKKIREEMEKS